MVGFKKFVIEVITGWRPSGDKKKYPNGINIYRVINKKNPTNKESYQEKIVDEKTGKICRNIKEPLCKHKHKQVKKN